MVPVNVDIILAVAGILFTAGGGGIVGALWQGLRGYAKIRDQHMEDLAKWRQELAVQVGRMQALIDYYRSMAADYEYQLRSHGIKPETTAVMPSFLREEDN